MIWNSGVPLNRRERYFWWSGRSISKGQKLKLLNLRLEARALIFHSRCYWSNLAWAGVNVSDMDLAPL